MPDAYDLQDGQFVQTASWTSAADGLLAQSPLVPAGRVWTVLRAYVTSSAAETQDYWFAVLSQTRYYPITMPIEGTINAAIARAFPCLREGMEIKLFPGEALAGLRDAATAGSTFSIFVSFIETDLPFYSELDKHAERDRKQRSIALSNLTRRGVGPLSGLTGGRVGAGGGVPRVK